MAAVKHEPRTVIAFPISIRRAHLHGYLVSLVGLLLLVEAASTALTAGLSLAVGCGGIVGLFAVGGGVLVSVAPDRHPRGSDPAPPQLYLIAGIATVAFPFAVAL